MAARIARTRAFWAWLPVVVLPPILILDAGLGDYGDKGGVSVLGVLSAFVACLPLVVRRRLGFFAISPLLVGGILLVLWQLQPGDSVVLIPAVALAELAARSDRRYLVWVAVALVPCVAISVLPFADDARDFMGITLRNIAYCYVALAGGDALRSRREAVERTAAAAEQEALRRLGEERLRIARDVHDVVAHAMVAINVQAGVAAHLADGDPGQARDALREIKATSGEALADLRATLGVLRDGDAPIVPAVGLGDLDDLAAGLRAAGVDVTLAVAPLAIPAPAGAAGYRIVQEAFTNAVRHGEATAVRVDVTGEGEDLVIEVTDDGRGTGADGGSGSGIRGMRERAAALGGTLDVGPRPGGGWRVAARLPTGAR